MAVDRRRAVPDVHLLDPDTTPARPVPGGRARDCDLMQLLGHRGSPDPTPENTLAAVERALRRGAHGVEVDVRLSADGVAVCHHDPGLNRTAGDPRAVSALTWAELQDLPLAVPRLVDVLDTVQGRGRLVVEVKTPAKPSTAEYEVLDVVADVLRGRDLAQVLVSSFDHPRLARLHRLLDVRTGLLLRPGVPMAVALRRTLADGHDEVHLHVLSALTRLDLVGWAHEHGLQVTTWTVDRPDHLRRLAAGGVDAAICDDPGAARDVLAQTSAVSLSA